MINELKNRHLKIKKILNEQNIDGILILQSIDLLYLTNSMQPAAAYLPANSDIIVFYKNAYEKIKSDCPLDLTLIKSVKQIPDILSKLGIDYPKVIGFEFDVLPVGIFNRYKKIFDKSSIVDISSIIRNVKMVKSEYELSLMRKCGAIVNKVFTIIKDYIKPGISELELAKEMEYLFRKEGHLGPSRVRGFNTEVFCGNVHSGITGNIPSSLDITLGGQGIHAAFSLGASDKKIEKNEAIVFDYLCNYKGYQTDTTRTFVIGKLPDILDKHVESLYEIYELCFDLMKPGSIPEDIYSEVLEFVRHKGLEDNFMGYKQDRVNFIGHGVGLELDEFPVIAPRVKQPLEKNMCVAVEPKLFFPPYGLIGLEDTIIITEDKPEILSKLDYNIVKI